MRDTIDPRPQEKLNKEVEEFLKKGGKITEVIYDEKAIKDQLAEKYRRLIK